MRLRYTLPALGDLTSILDYIGDRSPQGAARIRTRIRTVTDLKTIVPVFIGHGAQFGPRQSRIID